MPSATKAVTDTMRLASVGTSKDGERVYRSSILWHPAFRYPPGHKDAGYWRIMQVVTPQSRTSRTRSYARGVGCVTLVPVSECYVSLARMLADLQR